MTGCACSEASNNKSRFSSILCFETKNRSLDKGKGQMIYSSMAQAGDAAVSELTDGGVLQDHQLKCIHLIRFAALKCLHMTFTNAWHMSCSSVLSVEVSLSSS